MKILKLFLLIFISISFPVKADLDNKLEKQLKKGGNLIFIRHAYAPGGGDPENFIISDCSTQRNLNEDGKNQSKRIGQFFIENDILIDKVYLVSGADVKIQLKSHLQILKQKIF